MFGCLNAVFLYAIDPQSKVKYSSSLMMIDGIIPCTYVHDSISHMVDSVWLNAPFNPVSFWAANNCAAKIEPKLEIGMIGQDRTESNPFLSSWSLWSRTSESAHLQVPWLSDCKACLASKRTCLKWRKLCQKFISCPPMHMDMTWPFANMKEQWLIPNHTECCFLCHTVSINLKYLQDNDAADRKIGSVYK